jgi:hypothetical protein
MRRRRLKCSVLSKSSQRRTKIRSSTAASASSQPYSASASRRSHRTREELVTDKATESQAIAADDRTYEAPTLEVLGRVEDLAAANEDSLIPK